MGHSALFLMLLRIYGQLLAAEQSRPSAVGSWPQVVIPGAGISVPEENRNDNTNTASPISMVPIKEQLYVPDYAKGREC